MALDLDHLRKWIGQGEEISETLAASPLAGLAAILDRDDARPEPGSEVPPGGHWLYFNGAARQSELAADGHAKRGGFLPPAPLPRRMWAGGSLEFLEPLHLGAAARRVSRIVDVSGKQGRSGPLVFVLVRHEIYAAKKLALVEEQNLVFRGPPPGVASPSTPAPGKAVWRRTICPDPVLLFRYSALTFNSHRIHYDRPYAMAEEGYRGLVVHGPLTATLLLDLCRRERPRERIAKFQFCALAPLFDDAPFVIAGQPSADGGAANLWAENQKGVLAMTAEARFV